MIWIPEGRTKSVHNSEMSTLVKLGVATGQRSHCPQGWSLHKGGVSTGQGSTVIHISYVQPTTLSPVLN